MNDLAVLLPVLSLLASVVILRAVAVVTGGIEFDSWGAALGAVLIAYAVGFAAAYLMLRFPMQSPLQSIPSLIVSNGLVQLAVNVVSLVIAGAVLSGVHLKGVLGLLVAAAALTAVNLGMTYLPLVMPEMSAPGL
jgi:hypothetical protein